MGGGAGTRLFPLTKDRSKPAVPLGGKYRIVDIPISNCLNSGLRPIYVLTQFNSMSLHRHIQASYKFDNFSRSFIEILAAQQTRKARNGIRERPTRSARTCAISSSDPSIISSSSAATSFTGWISARCCINTFKPEPISRSRPSR